ncbi:MAG: adenylyltransferase/cytidyltransferase family protein [Verrucomicrobiota bacterium]|jgi:cytidyltransferase-like protein
MEPKHIAVTGAFDDPRSRDLRFLEEASKRGPLTVLLWSDEAVESATGRRPKFPLAERLYFLNAVRYVSRVLPVAGAVRPDALPAAAGFRADVWADAPSDATEARRAFCQAHGLEHWVLAPERLRGFPAPEVPAAPSHRKKVIVTGCFDWLHSGHVRFFEETSGYGDLYVIVGHDANIRLLKGGGHPLLPQEERRYLVGSIRYVTGALVSSGEGWLDAAPEIQRLQPDIYATNEDGDKGGKRDYCREHGIEYLVLKRAPAPGLAPRTSTDLRGF